MEWWASLLSDRISGPSPLVAIARGGVPGCCVRLELARCWWMCPCWRSRTWPFLSSNLPAGFCSATARATVAAGVCRSGWVGRWWSRSKRLICCQRCLIAKLLKNIGSLSRACDCSGRLAPLLDPVVCTGPNTIAMCCSQDDCCGPGATVGSNCVKPPALFMGPASCAVWSG